MCRARRDEERGFTAVYLALSITTVLLAGAFAVDLGWWYVRAQHAQRAADAAALAGVVWMPGDFPKAVTTARATAEANGFEHGVDAISVEVGVGSNNRQLSVRIVDGNVARFFSSLASSDEVSIGRRAVAQYELPVPLGGPENQFGAGLRNVYLAVNGFCTRRSDGDFLSSAYYHTTNPNATFPCPAQPYATATPPPFVAKNPDYRPSGYTYVVSIPPTQTAGCTVPSPPAGCTTTGSPVTIQVQDPTLNTDLAAPVADQYNFPTHSSCGTSRPGSTTFQVYKADTTPLDDSDNPPFLPLLSPFGTQSGTSTTWQDLATVPAGSLAGRYLVRVHSAADQICSAWSNAFGLRARVGATYAACSTLPGSPLPAGYPFCPQVHGLDAMGLRVALTAATTASCVGAKANPANLCTSFYLAQVDPVYSGRQMVITLFDPGEGAQRLKVLAPKVGSPNGVPVGFSYKTTDTSAALSGSVTAGSSGLDVSAATAASNFNDRKLELSLTLPSAADLGTGGGWFRVEYEVASTASSLTDRTTWSVVVRGAPVRLVS